MPLSWSWALRRIRSSALAASGLSLGGSSGRTTRTASVFLDVRRFARPSLTWACYRTAAFCDLRAAEQAFFLFGRLDIASPAATPRRCG